MKHQSLVITILICAIITPLHAARKCLYIETMGDMADRDPVTGNYNSSTAYACAHADKFSDYDNDLYNNELEQKYTGTLYACFDYEKEVKSSPYTYLTYCKNFRYECPYNMYRTSDDRCVFCPANSLATTAGTHSMSICPHCTQVGYYYDNATNKCTRCPDGGTTEEDGWNDITDCYITGGADATGRYEFKYGQCYYDED